MPDIIKLKIDTPTGPIKAGRGFYQLEEEALFVQVGIFSEKKHFFNFLENDTVQLDLDREGQLIFIELDQSRRHWQVDEHLKPPKRAEAADIKWLHFRESLPPCQIFTNKNKSSVKLSFHEHKNPFYYYLGDAIIVETDGDNNLNALWITDITDDFAGKEIACFRKKSRIEKSYFI